jgi:hypothetical protein
MTKPQSQPTAERTICALWSRGPLVPWFRGSVGYVQRSLLTSQTPLIHPTRATYDETPIPEDRGTYHLRFVVRVPVVP